MGIQYVEVEPENLKSTLSDVDHGGYVYVFFKGTFEDRLNNPSNESSSAEEVLADYLTLLPERRDITLLSVRLDETLYGEGNEFYEDPAFRVAYIPTIMRWRGPQRLVRHQCSSYPLLALLFEEDEPLVDIASDYDSEEETESEADSKHESFTEHEFLNEESEFDEYNIKTPLC